MTLKSEDRDKMIEIYMKKSEDSLEEAIILSERNLYNGAVNRAYYSIFQAEKALLLTKEILGDSHKHVHNSISREFVKSGVLSADTSSNIEKVQEIRQLGDYSGTRFVTEEEKEKAISEAKNFLDSVKKLIAQFQIETKKE